MMILNCTWRMKLTQAGNGDQKSEANQNKSTK